MNEQCGTCGQEINPEDECWITNNQMDVPVHADCVNIALEDNPSFYLDEEASMQAIEA